MDTPTEQQKINDYEARIGHWMGKQGALFQLKHATTMGSGALVRQLTGLFIKLVVVLIALAGLGYFLLPKILSGGKFESQLTSQISDVLGAEDVKVEGFTRTRSRASYGKMEFEGGDDSFFYQANFNGVKLPMGVLDGVSSETVIRSFVSDRCASEVVRG